MGQPNSLTMAPQDISLSGTNWPQSRKRTVDKRSGCGASRESPAKSAATAAPSLQTALTVFLDLPPDSNAPISIMAIRPAIGLRIIPHHRGSPLPSHANPKGPAPCAALGTLEPLAWSSSRLVTIVTAPSLLAARRIPAALFLFPQRRRLGFCSALPWRRENRKTQRGWARGEAAAPSGHSDNRAFASRFKLTPSSAALMASARCVCGGTRTMNLPL